ncbi:MAG: SRPBCC domain-containing protein [Candidatus Hydrogenedentes bacterium]|nr:SRPBCC domain-containing protein [Candidatus Hydrogenedentota bacterium]
MTKTKSDATNAAEREIVVSRVLDAPRSLVFEAWTDPKHVTQWWGPHRFTCPACELDLRPGGAYRIVMRAPNGADYPLTGVFREIVAPERLVMTIDWSEHPEEWHDLVNPTRDRSQRPSLAALQTVTFHELSGKTKLVIRIGFESIAIRDAMVKMDLSEACMQSLERLEAHLAHT